MSDPAVIAANKALARAFWNGLDTGDVAATCAAYFDGDVVWDGPAPVGRQTGPESYADVFWGPLRAAIPDLNRRTHIFMAGQSSAHEDGIGDGADWVAGTGYLEGTATSEFLGIPAHDTPLRIRWAEFLKIENGKITELQILLDFVDWFEQIGRPVLPKPKGIAGVYPAPTAYDGVLLDPSDAGETNHTLTFGREFLFGGLNAFDETALESMGMARYFDPNVKWYGPGGIGACLSLKEFEDNHQQPWLIAYPDRKVMGLASLFAEDRMLASSGIAGVEATHTGPYLGAEATGNHIRFSGIDFWLRTGEQFTENWVFVDMVHLFDQFGIDLFERMRKGGLS